MKKAYWSAKIIFAFSVVLFVFALSALRYTLSPKAAHYDSRTQTVDESLGYYADRRAGQRAAIQHIAAQMRQYPSSRYYKARFRLDWLDDYSDITDYGRAEKRFSNGDDLCGCGGGYDNVSESMIQSVANEKGTLHDLEKLGGQSYP